ncbi:MAG: endonuclease III [Muribaculaceae bacterium]|nr:endonuclease III [Muribaculaceae bacterium]
MTIKERYATVLGRLAEANPNPTTELTYSNEFEILVAVILSAQCTDKRVNLVTPGLFAAYPTPQAMAAATPDDILRHISSVSYPNSKARHLQAMARMLVDEFGGRVPDTMEQLTRLPGVGRKTANVMLGLVFGKAAIAVDTHVFRVANRIGLAHGKTPLEVEKALTRHIAPHLRYNAHHWLLLHGRYVCKALRPLCPECPLRDACRHYAQGTAAR